MNSEHMTHRELVNKYNEQKLELGCTKQANKVMREGLERIQLDGWEDKLMEDCTFEERFYTDEAKIAAAALTQADKIMEGEDDE